MIRSKEQKSSFGSKSIEDLLQKKNNTPFKIERLNLLLDGGVAGGLLGLLGITGGNVFRMFLLDSFDKLGQSLSFKSRLNGGIDLKKRRVKPKLCKMLVLSKKVCS